MATFDQFISSIRQEFGEQGAGKTFEAFCKWFLENGLEVGGGSLEVGVWKWESGGGRWEVGVWKWEFGGGSLEVGSGSLEVGVWRWEVGV